MEDTPPPAPWGHAAHHMGWIPVLVGQCLLELSVVFPTMMLLWVSQRLALATPHGLVCHVDHLQFDHCVNMS